MYTTQLETPLKAIVSKLEAYAGEKITIFKYNDFGFPIAIQTTLKELSIQPYAQYQNTLKIVHKPKRKRKYWGHRFYESDQLIVVEGWHDLDTRSTHDTIGSNQNAVTTQSKYACFDKQYMKDINKTLNTGIIVKMNV
ncbi:hypothetical protein PQ478_08710 [Alkalihalophilus pseudofirmus]|uniref:hypothetical protein n=1 Tax=Alkalihalophilus pseudofirmus TaxID=79885 RepID=UPI00259BB5CC|nr:hypothetical protein [Alkalihalophilus pseudofirmus]WEG18550.1 hypothetical protein PQ478_08710 [Alkalihalophilus pseudofirmus]